MEWKELSGNFRRNIRRRELLRVLPLIIFAVVMGVVGIVVLASLFMEHGFKTEYMPTMATIALVFLLLGLNCHTWFGLLFALRRDEMTLYRTGVCVSVGKQSQGSSAVLTRGSVENNQKYRYYKYEIGIEYDGSDEQELITTNRTRYKECEVGGGVYVVLYPLGKSEYLECYASMNV